MREHKQEFCGATGERYKEESVNLYDICALDECVLDEYGLIQERGWTYLPNHPQIPMQRLRRVQKDTVNAHAVHRRLELATNLAAFAHAAHDQFSTTLDGAHKFGDGALDVLLREVIGAVEHLEMAQGVALGRDDVKRRVEGMIDARWWWHICLSGGGGCVGE